MNSKMRIRRVGLMVGAASLAWILGGCTSFATSMAVGGTAELVRQVEQLTVGSGEEAGRLLVRGAFAAGREIANGHADDPMYDGPSVVQSGNTDAPLVRHGAAPRREGWTPMSSDDLPRPPLMVDALPDPIYRTASGDDRAFADADAEAIAKIEAGAPPLPGPFDSAEPAHAPVVTGGLRRVDAAMVP